MKIIILILLSFAIQSVFGAEPAKSNLVAVTARILSQPKDFEFPGCRCEHHTIKPVKAHSSELEIIVPEELSGKKLVIYHIPPLKEGSIWFSKGARVGFIIDQNSLGSMFSKRDRRYSYLRRMMSRIGSP